MTEDQKIAQSIEKHGWHAIAIDDGSIPFVYTCGLQFTCHHPDLTIFGLTSKMAYPILSQMVSEIKSGHSFEPDVLYENVLNVPICLRATHESQHDIYFGYAMAHRRMIGQAGTLLIRQVFWPDKNGYFPFQIECDPKVCLLQPRLEFMSWIENSEV